MDPFIQSELLSKALLERGRALQCGAKVWKTVCKLDLEASSRLQRNSDAVRGPEDLLSLPAKVKNRGRLSLSEGQGWRKKGTSVKKVVILIYYVTDVIINTPLK